MLLYHWYVAHHFIGDMTLRIHSKITQEIWAYKRNRKNSVMDFIYWILFAILVWGSGYFLTRLSVRKNLNEEAFIMAPDWLYLLCGMPKVTNIPVGALTVRGVAFQLTGILIVIVTLVGKVLDFVGLEFLQGYFIGIWFGCLGLGIILSLLLKKALPLSR